MKERPASSPQGSSTKDAKQRPTRDSSEEMKQGGGVDRAHPRGAGDEAPPLGRERASLASELDLVVGDVDAEGAAQTAFLVGLSGRHAGKLFRLRSGENIIGRASSALVRLDEKAASYQHAKLLLNSRGCFVVDLESTNGTFVNDSRVEEAVELRAGDVVRCGTSNFGFLTDAEDDEQHTRAMARLTATPATGNTGGASALVQRRAASGSPSAAIASVDHSMQPEGGEDSGDPLQTLNTLLDRLALAWRFFVRYWKLILASALVMACLGAASIEVRAPQAVASCEILLRGEDPRRRRREGDRLVDYFETADKNFTNFDLVRQTMKEMGNKTPGLGAVKRTARSLEFEPEGIGNYLLRFKHEDAGYAEKFLAAHVKNFLEKEIGKAIAVVKSEVDLLRKQFRENEDQLKALEAKVRDFKEKHLDALPENAAAQISGRASLVARRDQLKAQLQRARQELALARKRLDSGTTAAQAEKSRTLPYEQSLVAVRQDLAEARAQGFAETHPQVLKLKTKESELKRLLAEAKAQEITEQDRLASANHQELVNQVGHLEVQVNATQNELSMVQERLAKSGEIASKMPKVEAEYAELQRRLEAARALHRSLHERLKAKELQLDFERASVAARYEVMRQPYASPVRKTRTAAMRAGMGAGAGIVLGVVLAALHWLVQYSRERRRLGQAAIAGTSVVK